MMSCKVMASNIINSNIKVVNEIYHLINCIPNWLYQSKMTLEVNDLPHTSIWI